MYYSLGKEANNGREGKSRDLKASTYIFLWRLQWYWWGQWKWGRLSIRASKSSESSSKNFLALLVKLSFADAMTYVAYSWGLGFSNDKWYSVFFHVLIGNLPHPHYLIMWILLLLIVVSTLYILNIRTLCGVLNTNIIYFSIRLSIF